MAEENFNPNDLLVKVARPRLTVSMILSLVLHIILLGLTSIGFIRLCVHYKTMRPKDAVKAEQKAFEEAEKQKAQEDRIRNAQLKAQEEKAKKEAEEKKAAPQEPKTSEQPKKKSKIEQKLEETADPATATGSLDAGLSL